MADPKLITYATLLSSLNDLMSTATTLGIETQTHAEAHSVRLDALRTAQEHEGMIRDGIARSVGQV